MSIKRALIVDDSRSAQISLKKLLDAHDLAVELADSAEAALEFLKYESVDVIFMDHTMPGWMAFRPSR
jgi:CheY-like chemotaxis protein